MEELANGTHDCTYEPSKQNTWISVLADLPKETEEPLITVEVKLLNEVETEAYFIEGKFWFGNPPGSQVGFWRYKK